MSGQIVSVIGGRGMLGTDLVAHCIAIGIPVQAYDLPEFDITNDAQIEQVLARSKVIINCAAYTNVEKAEAETELAFRINGQAVGRLCKLAKEANVPVIHISTDFVFDGNQDRPYTEADIPNAISVYGKSKLEGEQLFLESGCKGCILRVQWTYGKAGTNFVVKILAAAQSGKPLRVIDDQAGSPTATREVAGVICEILKLQEIPGGIYHVAAEGYVSRYEMVQYMMETLGMHEVEVNPCKTSDFITAAARPLNSRFDCNKLHNLLGRKLRPWQEPLAEFLEQI